VLGPTREAHLVTVAVRDGVVTLDGRLTLHSTVESVGRSALCVPGVVAVRNHLDYQTDDLLITGL
jgi:osmotically-inducible protein OsmY